MTTDGAPIPDISPTLAAGGRRQWLYPDRQKGPKSKVRGRIAAVLMAIYLVTPWLSWNGRALLRVDLAAGDAHVWGQIFRFSETSYLAFIFLALALLLFFVTALRGRIWCGYACPQTVFVEWLIRPIEELIEGPAHKRRRRDQGPRTFDRVWRKALKHIVFLGISAVVANALLAYFAPPSHVLRWMVESPAAHPAAFGVMSIVGALVYFDLAWFREQFCAFVCPYARFQSVMMDKHTPVVAFDAGRGEPRGKKASGDCIDCGLCVRVCPTGIDIRDGLQLECISCFRCADACDMVMTNLGRPLGLIKAQPAAELRPWRARTIAFGAGLVAVSVLLIARAASRPNVAISFQRQAGATFATLPDGRIVKIYRAQVLPLEEGETAAAPGTWASDGRRYLRVAAADGWLDLLDVQLEGVVHGAHQRAHSHRQLPEPHLAEAVSIAMLKWQRTHQACSLAHSFMKILCAARCSTSITVFK